METNFTETIIIPVSGRFSKSHTRAQRVAYEGKCWIRSLGSDMVFAFKTKDISESGIFTTCTYPLHGFQKSSVVEVIVELPGRASVQFVGVPVRFIGKNKIGIKISVINELNRKRIVSFMEQHLLHSKNTLINERWSRKK